LLFNEIFKNCAGKIDDELETHFKTIEYTNDCDFEMMPKNTLSRDYEELYSSMAFSDVELEVEGKTLRAHKINFVK
jgi:hypothetical protein